MQQETCAIEGLVFVTKLSFVPAHKDKEEGFRVTLSCYFYRWYDSCGKDRAVWAWCVKPYSSYHNHKKVEMVVGIFLSTATTATLQRTTHQVTIVEVTIDWAIAP
jgi:hypothetical protein